VEKAMPFRHHLFVDAFDIRELGADTLDPEGYGGVVGELICLRWESPSYAAFLKIQASKNR
jgi:hypothetical protein